MIVITAVSPTLISLAVTFISESNNISFTCKDFQITGLLGPNGAGKTTTSAKLAYLAKQNGVIYQFQPKEKFLQFKEYSQITSPVYPSIFLA